MNFEEIKDFINAKKKYILLVLAVLAFLLFFRKNNAQPESKIVGNTEARQSLNQTASKSQVAQNSSSSSTVTVDITGAIKHQGVYTLKNGARIDELIKAAGGLKPNAQLKTINRAVMLKDQDKVHIPYRGEKTDPSSQTVNRQTASASQNSVSGKNDSPKINLNTATAADLQKLNGIGEKKAQEIISYRQQKGQFKKIEDLMQVSGIGEKTFAKLKDQLSL